MAQREKDQEILEFELGEYLERRWAATDDATIQAIDEEVWEKYGDYWSVMYTDLSGFSRDVYRHGILYTLGIIHAFRGIALPVIEGHGGVLMKTEGDSLIVLFREVTDALQAAVDISEALNRYNEEHTDHQIFNACGIGYGRILKLGDYDMYGLEVNLASKLGEDIGKGSEILLTEAAMARLKVDVAVTSEAFIMDAVLGLTAYRIIR